MDINDDETIDSEMCGFLLHCEAKTIEDLARRGVLPGIKLGKSWTFFRDQILTSARALAETGAQERRDLSGSRRPTAYSVEGPEPKRRGPVPLPPLTDEGS